MNNGMKCNTAPPTLSKIFDFNSNLPKEYERKKKWLATTSGLDEIREETQCSTQWLPIIKPKPPVPAMLIRSTTAPSIHCINSFLPMKIREVFCHIHTVFVSSRLTSGNKPMAYWTNEVHQGSQGSCTTRTESVGVCSSIHYSLPRYKALLISLHYKYCSSVRNISIIPKKKKKKDCINLLSFKMKAWIVTSLLFRWKCNTQISLYSGQKHE